MEEISQEMAKRNIRVEVLDVGDYIKDEATNELDETGVIEEIRRINPHMIFIVICYSQTLDFKFLLEGAGHLV